MRRTLCILLGIFSALLFCGCGKLRSTPPASPGQAQAPEVFVSQPITKEVTEYEDFTGQTQALHTVEVRSRVTGYLSKMYFEKREGTEVKEGEPLFEIDPRPYEAELAQAEANLAQSQAHARRLAADLKRAEQIVARGAMSREEYEKVVGDKQEADATVLSGTASRDRARLNLSYTKINAPISGRISRRMIDPWNVVKSEETPLTTIVSQDPIWANFDVDEPNVLRLRRLVRDGKMQDLQEAKMPVFLGLGDEEGFPHNGTVDFVDNQVDGNTGTLRMRGIFPNESRLLSPGLFIRIRLPIGGPHQALLVSEQALGRDQSQKYVFIVNSESKVEYRRVKVGKLYDGFREVLEGLASGERVIVSGLQRVRPDVLVEAKLIDMPSPEGSGVGSQASGVRSQGSGVRSQKDKSS
jgi:RND family efflux transporter MFP subunit